MRKQCKCKKSFDRTIQGEIFYYEYDKIMNYYNIIKDNIIIYNIDPYNFNNNDRGWQPE